MKINEMRELTVEEILQKLEETEKELFEARLKHSMHQLENKALLKTLRHRVAQLKTVQKEKQPQATVGG